MRGIDQISLSVPCGHCYGCRQSNTNDWAIRSFCQMQDAKAHNRIVGFITLTYDMRKQPWFVDGDSRFMCFDSNHIKTFLDTLRHRLKKDYGVTGLRYLICSEYGSHTKKPHYHALFDCPRSSSCSWFGSYQLHGLISELWNVHDFKNNVTGEVEQKGFGFVYPKNAFGGFDHRGYYHQPFEVNPDSVKAAKYCSKYVCKDLNFYEVPEVQEWLKNNPDDIDKVRRFLPKHWQSQGFGANLADVVRNSSDPTKFLDFGFHFPQDTFHYPLPQYIIRKLRYDFFYVDNPDDPEKKLVRRRLSTFGEFYAEHQTRKLIKDNIVRLSHSLSFIGLNSLLQTDDRCRELFNNDFGSIRELHQHLIDQLSFHSVEDLAIYKTIYRNVVIPTSANHDLFSISAYDFESFNSNDQFNAVAVPFYLERLRAYHKSGVSLSKGLHYHESFSLFNRLVHFSRFDHILQILVKVQNYSAQLSREAKADRNNKVNKVSQSFKENVP